MESCILKLISELNRHCTTAVGNHSISIYAGSLTANSLFNRGQLIPVESYVQHPEFNKDVKHNNDISILKVSHEVKIDK